MKSACKCTVIHCSFMLGISINKIKSEKNTSLERNTINKAIMQVPLELQHNKPKRGQKKIETEKAKFTKDCPSLQLPRFPYICSPPNRQIYKLLLLVNKNSRQCMVLE